MQKLQITQKASLRALICIYTLFFCALDSDGATRRWTGAADNANWGNACDGNWSACDDPDIADCDNLRIGQCYVGAGCPTINISCGGAPVTRDVRNFQTCCMANVFTFQNGTIRVNNNGNLDEGTTVFSCGGTLASTAGVGIGVGFGGNATLTITGCSSGICSGDSIHVGRCANGILNISGGATVTANCFIKIGDVCCGAGTINITDSTMISKCEQIKVGQCGDATIIATRSTIISGQCRSTDLDVGHIDGKESYFFMTGSAPVGCVYDSNLTVSQDFIVGHSQGGDGTVTFHNTKATFGNLAVSDSTCSTGTGYVYLTGQTCVEVLGTACGLAGAVGSKLGKGGTGLLAVNDCSVVKWSTSCSNNRVKIFGDGILCMGGGTVTGGRTCAGCCIAPAIFCLTNCGGDQGIIRGCGRIENDIRLNGGVFGRGDTAGDELILTGTITGPGNMIVEGSGIIHIGTDNMIDDAVDIDLAGGTLSTGGEDPGAGTGSNETVQNVTLSASSTIALGTGAHDFRMDDLTVGANTLTISGWTGTGGATGTAGRLLVLSTGSWALGDNGGAGFTGINWGALGTATEVLDAGGGWYELVPLASAVPEPSTYFTAAMLIALSFYFRMRKQHAVCTRINQPCRNKPLPHHTPTQP